jgi:quinol monooxygenase YgiN
MRFVQLRINPEYTSKFYEFYKDKVISELQDISGCLFVSLIQGESEQSEFISLTLWETKNQARLYGKSELYKKFINEIKPFLAESAEWKIQLTKDLNLDYLPIQEEPVLKQYTVTETEEKNVSDPSTNTKMHVRIVAVKIQEGKLEEFRLLYKNEILTVLKKTPGCRYAFLSENLQDKNEILSITIWNSKKDSEEYEQKGQFDMLQNKVKHTLDSFYQWKMVLDNRPDVNIKTSADMKISHYEIVTGKNFK